MASYSVGESTNRRTPRGWVIILGLLLSAVLAAFNWLQLANLERAFEGLSVPETQLLGYGVDYVEAVRAVMTEPFREQYRASHYLWDVLFSLVFAATLILLVRRIAWGRKIRWLYMAVPVLYAAVNITENIVLEVIFAAEAVTSSAVAFASTLTILKAVLFVLCLAVALLTLGTRPRPRR